MTDRERIAEIILPIRESRTWVNWNIACDIAQGIIDDGYARLAEPEMRCLDCEYHHCHFGADGQDCSCALSVLVTPTTHKPPSNCPLLQPEPAQDEVEAMAQRLFWTAFPTGDWSTAVAQEHFRNLARSSLKLCQPEPPADRAEAIAKIIRPLLHSDWYPQDAHDEVSWRVAREILKLIDKGE